MTDYAAQNRKQAAVNLALQGLSHKAIAERLGCSPKAVGRMVKGTDADRPNIYNLYGLAERHADLVRMWQDGASATEIATQTGATRNAVLGYVHRNRADFARRLAGMREGDRAKLMQAKAPKPRNPPRQKRAFTECKTPETLLRDLFQLSGASRADGVVRFGVSLMDLAHGQCKWPINASENGAGHRFCGDPAGEGVPYCAEHAAFSCTTQAALKAASDKWHAARRKEKRSPLLSLALGAA